MSARRMAIAAGLFLTLVLWVFIVLPPSADQIALFLIIAAAPASTLFAVLYGFTTPWWREPIGRALFVSAWALALLIDTSLAYRVLGDDYWLRDVVKISVFALICGGAYLMLIALGIEKFHARQDRKAHRVRRDATDWER